MTTEYVIEYLLINIFWIYVIYRYIGLFFEQTKASKIQMFMMYFGFYCLNSISSLVLKNPVCNMLTSLLGIFMITMFYQAHISKKILATLLIYIISMMCDIIVANIVGSYIIGKRMDIVSNVITYLLIFTMELFVEKYMQFRSGQILSRFHAFVIIAVPLSSIGIILVLVINEVANRKILVMISCVLLFINYLVIYLYGILLKDYDEMYQTRLLKKEISAYREQLELYEQSQKRMEQIRHDMKHHFVAILNMAKCEELDKIQNYTSQMIENVTLNKQYIMSGNTDVDSMLNYMIQKAKDKGIKVGTSIKIPTRIQIESIDFNIILGNLLENAIEAAEHSDEKYINIGLELERNIFYIDIENSHKGNIKTRGKKLVTTKTETGHGYGIKNVKAAIEKYNGEMNASYDESKFYVSIMMYITT